MLYPTTAALIALLEKKIPAVTLGFTTGKRKNEFDELEEMIAIPPMSIGLAQIIGILRFIDEGLCDEKNGKKKK